VEGRFIIEKPDADLRNFGWPANFASIKADLDDWRNDQHSDVESLFCTLMEHCDCGSLDDFARDVQHSDKKFKTVVQLFLQTSFALQTVHDKCEYLHYDLKPQVRR